MLRAILWASIIFLSACNQESYLTDKDSRGFDKELERIQDILDEVESSLEEIESQVSELSIDRRNVDPAELEQEVDDARQRLAKAIESLGVFRVSVEELPSESDF